MQIDGLDMTIMGKFLKVTRITDERYIDVNDPETLIKKVEGSKLKADIFTFAQRIPYSKPKYDYYMEYEAWATLPIKDYSYWFENQIPKQTRTSLKKARKQGVTVKQAEFDRDFISGMAEIFNESPIRQGKPFWHYGKRFEDVKSEFSKFLYREDLFGAYYKDELIGFLFLAYAGHYAITIQIISKLKFQDKKPSNALMAKAVEVCAEKKIPYLVYGPWSRGDWGAFKKHNGFESIIIPRYYVPLSFKGMLALKFHLHNGLKPFIPENVMTYLIKLRKKYYNRIYRKV